MDLYLTFDDGIQAGTEEVLDVLEQTNVEATFFLIGIHVSSAFRKNPDRSRRLLKRIVGHHCIGNHSYSHAHYKFNDYYKNNGVQTDSRGSRRCVVDDFLMSEKMFCALESEAKSNSQNAESYVFTETSKKSIARLPGRNTWYLTATSFQQGNSRPIIFSNRREKNTIPIAEELNKNGYDVFGWNLEWEMTFNYHKEALDKIERAKSLGEYNFSNEETMYPDFDMYRPGEEWKDRLSEGWKECFSKIMFSKNQKMILLMHDRAFRKGEYRANQAGSDTDFKLINASEELRCLLTALKEQNVRFRKLDEY